MQGSMQRAQDYQHNFTRQSCVWLHADPGPARPRTPTSYSSTHGEHELYAAAAAAALLDALYAAAGVLNPQAHCLGYQQRLCACLQ